jgi:hypothetical protein
MGDHPFGGRINDAGEQRNPAIHLRGGVLEYAAARGIVVEHDLAGRPEQEETVHTTIEKVIDDAGQGGMVNLERGGEWSDHGRDDTGKQGHFIPFS